jgi:hypothetical protein
MLMSFDPSTSYAGECPVLREDRTLVIRQWRNNRAISKAAIIRRCEFPLQASHGAFSREACGDPIFRACEGFGQPVVPSEVIHTMFRRAESASGDAASSRAASNKETQRELALDS